MAIDVLFTIIVTTIIQSIFGVGVLLFGTPLLLLLGYNFINALVILLPISIAINSLQILKHYQHIDWVFYQKILLYTVPFIMFFLFIATTAKININFIVGIFLVFVALRSYATKINQMLKMMLKYERSYLATMGIIHGLTNLGGSLLTAIAHSKQYQKDTTRVTVAICYATFALFQIITLLFLTASYEFSYSENIAFLQVGVIVFLLTEEALYAHIDNQKYNKIFAAFLLISGVVLLAKSF